ELLREEYAPALIDSVNLSPVSAGRQRAAVSLHTRGPIEADLPAYTLRGYTLHWVLISPDRRIKFSEGDVLLPVLVPGSVWSAEIEWAAPDEEYALMLSIVRPTGSAVIEKLYNSSGELIP
ncbi:MAG TPA: hypothetical protein VGJ22_13380, partial [Anaerolineales bacterium]